MAATKNTLQKLLDLSGQFVTKQKGAWEHADWEKALQDAAKLGFEMNDETKRNFGNILEAAKHFYCTMPAKPAKKAPARKKAAAKKK